MATLYSHDGKIYDWSDDLLNIISNDYKLSNSKEILNSIKLIQKGDPLTCEYRMISIISNNFDTLTQSEVMLVNYVKHSATKESAMQSITYYDDDAKTSDINIKGKWFKKLKIGPFDSSEYGHPVFFHTSGYKGETVNITTKMWEVNDSSSLQKFFDIIKTGIGLAGSVSGSPYLNIANTAFGISSQILVGFVQHEELCPNHTLELRLDSENHPLLEGKYICFPGPIDLNHKYYIIENYKLIDNLLVTKDSNGQYHEYYKTYFVIKVTNEPREDLADFDFTASSADLLGKINSGKYSVNDLTEDILTIQKDAYDLYLIKTVQKDYDSYIGAIDEDKEDLKQELIASYKQLANSKDQLEWFNTNFPHIKSEIQNYI